MRAMLIVTLSAFSLSASAAQYYAATGDFDNVRFDPTQNRVLYNSYLPEMARYGVRPNLMVLFDGPDALPGEPLHGYQMTAQMMADVLNEAQARTGQRKIILDLFSLFFVNHNYAPGSTTCPGYQAPAGTPAANGRVGSRPELRSGDSNHNMVPDYRDRMADFMSRLSTPVTAANFEFISVNPESGCVPPADINAAAQTVKDFIPNVKVAAGYEISVDARPELFPGNGVNHIGKFPSTLDRVLTWSYGVFNPANDADPLNAHDPLYPNSNFTSNFNALKNKLRAWQTIDWVIDAHYINTRHGKPLHWVMGTHHARAAVNWCNWVRGQPLVNGMVAFTYGPSPEDHDFFSFAEMPEIVRDTHANLSAGVCALPDTLLAADAYTPSPAGTATAGANLNGRATEVGGVNWIASSSVVGIVGAGGDALGDGYATSTLGANPMAVVPVVGANNRPLLLTADVNPQGTEWVAIGLSGFANHGWFGDGQLWIYLKNSGRYNVLANGTAISLTGGERFDARIRPNEQNRVQLYYDPTARTVALRINGFDLLAATALPMGYTPVTSYAGWSALNASSSIKVDSFELRRR
ncbi:MAG: hypothetical protein ABI411_05280 [Tahibacter sp.]